MWAISLSTSQYHQLILSGDQSANLAKQNKANRLDYFHYMWDALPADDSVRCQSSSVQKSIGHVQEGVTMHSSSSFGTR